MIGHHKHISTIHGNVSATFNVTDLSLYDVGDSRMNPFEEGGNDGDQLAQHLFPTILMIFCKELEV